MKALPLRTRVEGKMRCVTTQGHRRDQLDQDDGDDTAGRLRKIRGSPLASESFNSASTVLTSGYSCVTEMIATWSVL